MKSHEFARLLPGMPDLDLFAVETHCSKRMLMEVGSATTEKVCTECGEIDPGFVGSKRCSRKDHNNNEEVIIISTM